MSIDRREFMRKASLTMVGGAVALNELSNPVTALAAAALAPAADPELSFYFPKTGHHVTGEFLDFWRRNRNGFIFGLPITEEEVNKDSYWKTQYFENVRLDKVPYINHVTLGPLGIEKTLIEGKTDDALRSVGGLNALMYSKYSIDVGHSIGDLEFTSEGSIQTTEYVVSFRRPAFDVTPESDALWQYRNNALNLNILWPDQVTLLPIGRQIAENKGIDTVGVPQKKGSLRYDPNMFDRQKKIEVDLITQHLMAYEGDTPVINTPVSTGKPGYETPVGDFSVIWKVPSLDYISPFSEVKYLQPAVPYNLEFDHLTYIHGAYWHDEFGTRRNFGRSYGCVNIDPYDAAWLYDWARYGTPVRIHQ